MKAIMTALVTLILTCTIVASGAASCPHLIENKMTSEDISAVVNKHNQLRALIASGKVPGQPKGVNVGNLTWDPALAKEAQKIANSCKYKHVKVTDPRWHAVGQNLGITKSTLRENGADWNYVVQLWFDEFKDFKYPNISNSTLHYTQVVWADTKYIGCGYTHYFRKGWFTKFYVCNYGPSGNYISKTPYRTS